MDVRYFSFIVVKTTLVAKHVIELHENIFISMMILIVLDSSNFYACIWQSCRLPTCTFNFRAQCISFFFFFVFFVSISSELIFRTKTRSYRILAVLQPHRYREGVERRKQKSWATCFSLVCVCVSSNRFHRSWTFLISMKWKRAIISMHLNCRVVAIVFDWMHFACTNWFYGDFFSRESPVKTEKYGIREKRSHDLIAYFWKLLLFFFFWVYCWNCVLKGSCMNQNEATKMPLIEYRLFFVIEMFDSKEEFL